MSKTWRIIFAVLTLLTIAACLTLAVVGVVVKSPVLVVVCLALTAIFGVFAYNDYKYFTGKSS
jgi:hypothetical protein